MPGAAPTLGRGRRRCAARAARVQSVALTRQLVEAAQFRLDLAHAMLDRLRHIG
jgi:hypothetical protein